MKEVTGAEVANAIPTTETSAVIATNATQDIDMTDVKPAQRDVESTGQGRDRSLTLENITYHEEPQ